MTFNFIISPELERRLDKLAHEDKTLALAVRKKIQQIISCDETTIYHFKNLRGDMSDYKRVQLGSFKKDSFTRVVCVTRRRRK